MSSAISPALENLFRETEEHPWKQKYEDGHIPIPMGPAYCSGKLEGINDLENLYINQSTLLFLENDLKLNGYTLNARLNNNPRSLSTMNM